MTETGSTSVHFWRSVYHNGKWACSAAQRTEPYRDGAGNWRVLKPVGHIGYGHTVEAARKAWHHTPD